MVEVALFFTILFIFVVFHFRSEDVKRRRAELAEIQAAEPCPCTGENKSETEPCSGAPVKEEKPKRKIDWEKGGLFKQGAYNPPGTPYFHCPDHPHAWTHKGKLLIDPDIGKTFHEMGPKSIVNNSKKAFEQLALLAGWAEESGGCRLERTFWWDNDDNPTPATYRPYITFGVVPYDFEEEEGPVDPEKLSVCLQNPTPEELRKTVDKFEKITQFSFTVSGVDEDGDGEEKENQE
jgi:hypothetical protein